MNRTRISSAYERITHLKKLLLGLLGDELGGFIIAILDSSLTVFIAGIWLLGLLGAIADTEYRLDTLGKALQEIPSRVVAVPAGTIDPANEGKLVYVVGTVTAAVYAHDGELGIRLDALRLRRKVELYQWDEICHERSVHRSGSPTQTTRTYSQSKTWHHTLIDSRKFQNPSSFANPLDFGPGSREFVASGITLGAFNLPPNLLERFIGEAPAIMGELPVSPVFSGMGNSSPKPLADGWYFGANPESPAIGDRRIRYTIWRPVTLSVIAMQQGNGFVPYPLHGSHIDLYGLGTLSINELLDQAKAKTGTANSGSKVAGFVLLFPCLFILARKIPRNSKSFAGLRLWVREDSLGSLLLVTGGLTLFFLGSVWAHHHLSSILLLPGLVAGLMYRSFRKTSAERGGSRQ